MRKFTILFNNLMLAKVGSHLEADAHSDVYPAHLHLNLLPRLQGRGIGAQLLRNWLVLAQGRGAEAVHVSINRENMRGLAFWARHGFSALAVEDGSTRTVWMGRSLSLV